MIINSLLVEKQDTASPIDDLIGCDGVYRKTKRGEMEAATMSSTQLTFCPHEQIATIGALVASWGFVSARFGIALPPQVTIRCEYTPSPATADGESEFAQTVHKVSESECQRESCLLHCASRNYCCLCDGFCQYHLGLAMALQEKARKVLQACSVEV